MAIEFAAPHWAETANLYEVNIRQYTAAGTFRAFEAHLPRLRDMGIDIFWLMPVTPVSEDRRQGTLGSYYACRSYTALNPEFGSESDFRSLVNRCHALGGKIIIDWVANHTGCDHPWVQQHPGWYKRDENGAPAILHGWSDVYHLDYAQPGLADEMIAAMLYWVREFDIDGFRCDMAHLVPLWFWKQARRACDAVKPLFWLAETEDLPYHEVFDATYAWEWMHASRARVQEHTGHQNLQHILEKYAGYAKAGSPKLMFTSNHDENSWNGSEYERYGEAARLLAVLCALAPGIPLVYSGQEKPNYRRLAFFDKDELYWEGDVLLHDFYKRLFTLRKQSAALRNDAELKLLPGSSPDDVITMARRHGEARVLGVFNFSAGPRQVEVQHEWIQGRMYQLFSGLPSDHHGKLALRLEPYSFTVLTTEPVWSSR